MDQIKSGFSHSPPPLPVVLLVAAAMLCIIIPFREQPQFDRSGQLRELLQHLRHHLRVAYRVLVVEQSQDRRLFNRGALLNVGVKLLGRPSAHTVILHDVDLIPCPQMLLHYRSGDGINHLARRWMRYSDNPRYLGGVLRMPASTFHTLNGFPNTYWGWGGEDDDMNRRIESLELPVSCPAAGEYTDLERCSLQQKLDLLRQHRLKCMTKWELLQEQPRTWRTNGMNNVDFHLVRCEQLDRHAMKYTVHLLSGPGEAAKRMRT